MKIYISTVLLIIYSVLSFGQIKVGNQPIGPTDPKDAIMMFSDFDPQSNTMGIILPAVLDHKGIRVTDSKMVIDSANLDNLGTLIFDIKERKIKFLSYDTDKKQPIWENLTPTGTNSEILKTFGYDNLPLNYSDLESFARNNESNQKQGVIIGAMTSKAEGALILESEDKALMLPKMADVYNKIDNPYPGMMCYDTVADAIAIFDGNVWHYWR